MRLDELKTGMIVKTREGKYHIIMKDFIDSGDILAGISCNNILNSYIELSHYEQDMKHKQSPDCDIMSVYSSYPGDINIPRMLLWKREEEYKIVTMKEIEEKFGCKVKIVGSEEEHNDGWIPCSERLPENDDDVLCWYEYRIMQGTHEGEMNQEYGIGYYNKYFKRWGGEVSCGRDCKVIAWKPLPKPYKEDEEE